MGIWEGLKRASIATAEGDPPARYVAGGKPIACEHCGHEEFDERVAPWGARRGATLVCDACGRIQYYATKPERR